jgi:hypothetical protein
MRKQREKEIQMSIAKTILDQIKTIDPRATWAWGAKDMVAMENGLRFKTTGMVKNKGYVTIKLNGSDLYDIEFGKVRKFKYKAMKREEDVFAEDMVNFIDTMVG